MKKRFAAHYIFLGEGRIYKQYYLELGDNDEIKGVYPLETEIEGTVFHNGILFPVSGKWNLHPTEIFDRLKELSRIYPENSVFRLLEDSGWVCDERDIPVHVFQLDGIDLVAVKFCTDNRNYNPQISRVC
ncbi:MAG: hypothetical protein LBU57_03325 [Dysgonamonadaceae bacterium]|jgi:hypothetical protein|nr:hypothetical protein [Dysgonamonadaceae bacterium]